MNPDRVFLDANILFSAAYGSPGAERLWILARKRKCLLLASGYVIEEARRNLHNAEQLNRFDSLLKDVDRVLEAPAGLECPIPLPEKDRPVLMAAVCAKADYLITGDLTHFREYFGHEILGVRIALLRDYAGIRQVRPSAPGPESPHSPIRNRSSRPPARNR